MVFLLLIADKIIVHHSRVQCTGAVPALRYPLPALLARCVTSCATVQRPLRNCQSQPYSRIGVLELQRVAATRQIRALRSGTSQLHLITSLLPTVSLREKQTLTHFLLFYRPRTRRRTPLIIIIIISRNSRCRISRISTSGTKPAMRTIKRLGHG